jgi:tetratricopeptide (TPR) repeat protein
MKQKYALVIIFLVLWGVANAQVDPFYLQAFEAGKKLVQQKLYEQAVARFKISEFGLLEETAVLKELYLYSAYSYYKLDQLEDVRETMKKYKANVGSIDLDFPDMEPSLAREITSMLTELNYIGRSKQVAQLKSKSSSRQTSQSPRIKKTEGFASVREMIKGKQLEEAARHLKKLKRTHRKAPEIALLEGLFSFYSENYGECIERLVNIYGSLKGQDRDEASYYLVLSYYFKKNFGQSLAYYQKIYDRQTRKQLDNIYNKILNGRQGNINRLAENFSIGELEKLVRRYAGDQFLCEAIFKRVLAIKRRDDPTIEPVIYGCMRYSGAINGDFIVLAADYLKSIDKSRNAVKLMRRFLSDRPLDEADIDVYYTLGKLLLEASNSRAALKEFSIVDKLRPGYRESRKYIYEINRLHKNRKK